MTYDQIEDVSKEDNKSLNRKTSKKSNVNLKWEEMDEGYRIMNINR